MALDPNTLMYEGVSVPLTTGFTYVPQTEYPDFELRPELWSEITERLAEFDKYKRPPYTAASADYEPSHRRPPRGWMESSQITETRGEA